MTRDIYSARKLSINLQTITEIEIIWDALQAILVQYISFSPEQSIIEGMAEH